MGGLLDVIRRMTQQGSMMKPSAPGLKDMTKSSAPLGLPQGPIGTPAAIGARPTLNPQIIQHALGLINQGRPQPAAWQMFQQMRGGAR
jgi:hypothetical protein